MRWIPQISSPRRRLILAVLALLGLLSVALVADARGGWRPRPRPRPWHPPPTAVFRVTLEDGEGRGLRTFSHQGQTFVLGELGERYAIRVHNPTGQRVEAVVSVDGRDVVSGRPADFVGDRGYLVPAHGSVLIAGFRQSLSAVATFRFSDPDDSYSSRRGTPENVGVIGVAFFPERAREPLAAPEAKRKHWRAPKSAPRAPRSRSAGDDRANAPSEDAPGSLGTEYGESRGDEAVEVPFERANESHPARLVTVRYDDAEGLEARGIEVFWRRSATAPSRPDPFPRSRFAPPP